MTELRKKLEEYIIFTESFDELYRDDKLSTLKSISEELDYCKKLVGLVVTKYATVWGVADGILAYNSGSELGLKEEFRNRHHSDSFLPSYLKYEGESFLLTSKLYEEFEKDLMFKKIQRLLQHIFEEEYIDFSKITIEDLKKGYDKKVTYSNLVRMLASCLQISPYEVINKSNLCL